MNLYRHGGKQRRNIYRVTDEHPEGIYIGVFFEEADAVIAVSALNTATGLLIHEPGPIIKAASGWVAPGGD